MIRKVFSSLVILCTAALAAAEPLRIGVSLLPIESLVREIGGEAVEVSSVQGEGDSCSVFEPRPSAIASLAGVSLYFRIGAAFENTLLPRIQSRFPEMTVVDIRDGIHVLSTTGHEHGHHDHENCAGHDDPHVWLDPVLLQALAWNVARSLADALPQDRELFEQRAQSYCVQLAQLHEWLGSTLAPHRGRAFFIYHPALGYFAERYGLEQIAIESSGNGSTVRELHEFMRRASERPVTAIFVQPQESRRHAEIVASAIGADVIEINPMSTELIANLKQIGTLVETVFAND